MKQSEALAAEDVRTGFKGEQALAEGNFNGMRIRNIDEGDIYE